MVVTSEKTGEYDGWSSVNTPEAPPEYQQQHSSLRGPPLPLGNPNYEPSSYSDGKGGSRGLAASYFSPPPGPPAPYVSVSPFYPPGPSPYSGPGSAGPLQPQTPLQGYLPSPTAYSPGGTPHPDDANRGQHLPGFTYTGRAPSPKRDPFNPPPPSFLRQPNPQCAYPLLPEPVRIPAQDKSTLDKGFVPLFPAPQLLLAHDVHPADVARLLEDCHLMSTLGIGQKVAAGVAPLMLHVGLFPGIFITRAIEKRMKRGHVEDVAGLVAVWDEAFFAPRRLRLALQRGRANNAEPDLSSQPDPDSSDSDSSSDDGRAHPHEGRGQAAGEAEPRRPTHGERRAAKRPVATSAEQRSGLRRPSARPRSDAARGEEGFKTERRCQCC